MKLLLGLIAVALTVQNLAIAGPRNGNEVAECFKKQNERQRDPRAAFSKRSNAAISDALRSPETLWNFVTDPATPYLDRRAAASQAFSILPIRDIPTVWLPRIMAAQSELSQIGGHFGLGVPACSAVADFMVRENARRGEVVTLLGHKWMLPKERSPYPLTIDEEVEAPWPWQVQQALGNMSGSIFDGVNRSGREKEFLDAAMHLPIETDEEALLYLRVSNYVSHRKSFPTMGRWRVIGMAASKPNATAWVAREIGNAARLWNHRLGRSIGDVIILDVAESTRNPGVLWSALSSYRSLHDVPPYERREGKRVQSSPTLNLLFMKSILDPSRGSSLVRLSNLDLFAPLTDDAAIEYHDLSEIGNDDAALKKRLVEVEKWFAKKKAGWQKAALREQKLLAEARNKLVNSK